MSTPAMTQIEVDKLNDAQYTLSAIRGLSDLLCNMGTQSDIHLVRPENLNCLIDILADRLEQVIG